MDILEELIRVNMTDRFSIYIIDRFEKKKTIIDDKTLKIILTDAINKKNRYKPINNINYDDGVFISVTGTNNITRIINLIPSLNSLEKRLRTLDEFTREWFDLHYFILDRSLYGRYNTYKYKMLLRFDKPIKHLKELDDESIRDISLIIYLSITTIKRNGV